MPRKARRRAWGSVTEMTRGKKYVLRWVENTPSGRKRRSRTVYGTYREACNELAKIQATRCDERVMPTVGQLYEARYLPWLERKYDGSESGHAEELPARLEELLRAAMGRRAHRPGEAARRARMARRLGLRQRIQLDDSDAPHARLRGEPGTNPVKPVQARIRDAAKNAAPLERRVHTRTGRGDARANRGDAVRGGVHTGGFRRLPHWREPWRARGGRARDSGGRRALRRRVNRQSRLET